MKVLTVAFRVCPPRGGADSAGTCQKVDVREAVSTWSPVTLGWDVVPLVDGICSSWERPSERKEGSGGFLCWIWGVVPDGRGSPSPSIP